MGLVRMRGAACREYLRSLVDAKPYRLKLILLAHTVVVAGAILLFAIVTRGRSITPGLSLH